MLNLHEEFLDIPPEPLPLMIDIDPLPISLDSLPPKILNSPQQSNNTKLRRRPKIIALYEKLLCGDTPYRRKRDFTKGFRVQRQCTENISSTRETITIFETFNLEKEHILQEKSKQWKNKPAQKKRPRARKPRKPRKRKKISEKKPRRKKVLDDDYVQDRPIKTEPFQPLRRSKRANRGINNRIGMQNYLIG